MAITSPVPALTLRSATDLATAIRRKEVSAREVVQAHVDRLHARQPRTNALAVQRLIDAGFIPLGVTNTSEMTMWIESNNRVYGRTRNAYDPHRTAGGSSGGEGAAVGAGGVPVGLGSDIGGSIRVPAFFNRVFGH